MTRKDAKPGLRVADDFGAIGTIERKAPEPDMVLVRWDGEERAATVHVARIRPV